MVDPLGRPDQKAVDRQHDTFPLRVGALALRRRIGPILETLAGWTASSGNCRTMLAKLGRAAGKRNALKQTDTMVKAGWPVVPVGGPISFIHCAAASENFKAAFGGVLRAFFPNVPMHEAYGLFTQADTGPKARANPQTL